MKKKIYVIGVGLIGGSFAIDMRKLFPKSTIIGIDKSEIHLKFTFLGKSMLTQLTIQVLENFFRMAIIK